MTRLIRSAVTLLAAIVVALAASSAATEDSLLARRRYHAHHVRKAFSNEEAHDLSKRSISGKGTFYGMKPGNRGACGDLLNANEHIVALNAPQYGNLDSVSQYCHKTISISYGGKTTTAIIKDACPECLHGGLDMSRSLFDFFASEDTGIIDLNWSFADDNHAAKQAAQDAAKKKAEEDAANEKKKEEEDAANRKKAEEEAAANKKKAEEEAAANKKKADEEEDDKRKADAAKKAAEDRKAAEAKKVADSKKAAEDKKSADAKKAADEEAAKKRKEEEDQKAKDGAAEKEKKAKEHPLGQPKEKVVESKKVDKEQVKPTANFASFRSIMRGLDQIVQDASDSNLT